MCLQPESEDDLKKLQLMELAIMNGTYRGVEGNVVPFVAAAVSRTFNSIILHQYTVYATTAVLLYVNIITCFARSLKKRSLFNLMCSPKITFV